MAAPACTLQPCGFAAPRALRAVPSRATCSSLGLAGSALRLHQFARPAAQLLQRQGTKRQGSLPSGGQGRPALQVQAQQEQQQQPTPEQPGSSAVTLSSVGLFALWAGLVAYAFFLSPNQTPIRDQIFLERILKEGVGMEITDTVYKVNVIFTKLFYLMGVYPIVYTALLFPSGRSGNGVPAWPFVSLSYAFGAFGLLPYMALWTPPKDPPVVPPPKEDLQGARNMIVKGMESPITGVAVLVGALVLLYQAATAGGEAWAEYFELFDESRFVHVTSIDFLTLSALAPFWMYNDAELRKWELRDKVLPVLSLIPLVGPCIYLCLRPKAQ